LPPADIDIAESSSTCGQGRQVGERLGDQRKGAVRDKDQGGLWRLMAVQNQRERAEAEKRRSELGVEVVVALGERDAARGRHERSAGAALVALTRDEGLTITEACEWAGDLGAPRPSDSSG